MSFGQTLKRKAREALLPLGFAALCGYFAWHSIHGEFGTMAREQRQKDVAAAREVLARAIEERDRIERRVNGLRGTEIDRDQLDERARTLLNLVGKDEIVIPYEPGRRLY
ncbi:septum formation initiator family protein [Siccirubricoccus sp. KC 17139]|uniref:Septum formation initiator family protein n=1 Tax=Siccirubricoccus soli TaxID=2899147 RepID=A0ABT1D652_9PROT|nr:septum formation initiator family protein [Siccirubricoccus soli]MCO6416755.1 septum formation initiator family protein [Siccirubricoccus soli]MCP2682890.1 septum formation initiator family protein [Siccirubricoccus soli]